MADFLTAHNKTMGTEGGYANNPADAGGETYKGIARKFWHRWAGWPVVDQVKKTMTKQPPYGSGAYFNWAKALNKLLAANLTLQKHVLTFYMVNFWDANRLGEINDQAVAEWTYDHIVNAGARGAMWLQLAACVKADGGIGPATIAAVNACDPSQLLARCEDIAAAYRLDKAAANPSQIQFLTSWLTRDGQPAAIIAQVKKAAADGVLDAQEVATLKTAMDPTQHGPKATA